VCCNTGRDISYDHGPKHNSHAEEEAQWHRVVLQDETLLLRKQALL
jgi:hypothetical protein